MADHSHDGKKGYAALAGIAVLVFLNIALSFIKPLAKVDPESLPSAHTWVWWATQEFVEQKRAPDVVLLGSSLVMHPVSRQDADFLNRDIDYVTHHRSNYMEGELSRRLPMKQSPVCYNFALPGGMVSDDFIVAKALFKGERKPSLVILGLSVRDFIDSGVSCAGATPAFKYLKRYTDISDILDISMPQLWNRMDYLTGEALYLWGKKLDVQVMLAEQTRTALGPFFAKHFGASRLAEADVSRNLPSNLRSEVEKGMMIVKAHQPYSYEDNSAEYKKRYRMKHPEMLALQAEFLNRLLKLAKKEGIEVLIANMPLTAQNHALMPPGVYEKYLQTVKACAANGGCEFVDLDGKGVFDLKDYYDTSHMNSSGGRKLIDELVEAVCRRSDIAQSLISRPVRLAGDGATH